MKKLNKWHIVAKKDRERITCQHGLEPCKQHAVICVHISWQAGGRSGISFFYYCTKHSKERQQNT